VIAANHGGVAEIVMDGITGSLIEPRSIESLRAAITGYLENPARLNAEGIAGRLRFETEFDERLYKCKIAKVIANLAGPALND
jgi:glycosyltransferase involved in cell wall biosynthesis